jgi:hypothetical protein
MPLPQHPKVVGHVAHDDVCEGARSWYRKRVHRAP